ncbi:MAG TPA: ATP-grasp domain-containing protein [Actinospica sp.]|nr:ATP-grasp domain-containing protein [Actinospica sp.]
MRRERARVLLLGCDRYVLDACVRLDVDAVVVCGTASRDDALVRVPEQFPMLAVDSVLNPESVLGALHRAGFGETEFDGVQSTDEWALVTAALLAGHLGCRGPAPETVLRFRDKSLQKRRLAEAGIPVARCQVVEDVHDVSAVDPGLLPGVLKPVNGAGTARTSVVRDAAELAARSEEYRKLGLSQRTFLLEELVEGEEWIADGFVFDGELVFCAVGRYNDPCLKVLNAEIPLCLRHFDPQSEAAAYELALPVVEGALRALGLRDGVFHMELFHDPDAGSLVFGECAARRGGGLIHEQLQAKFNVNTAEAALLCALGRRPEPVVKARPEVIGSTFLITPPGTVLDFPSPAELCALPGVRFARMERPRGQHYGAGLASTNQRIGQVLVSARTEEELVERFEEVGRWYRERLLVLPEGLTGGELRAWQRRHWPDKDYGDVLWT